MNFLKSILIFFKTIIYFMFDSLVFLKTCSKKKNKLELILLIRQDLIGDFILWLDTAKEYRNLYPRGKYRIVLVGNELWCNLAETFPYWDEVFPVNVNKFRTLSLYRFKILSQIADLDSKIAIQPTYSREYYNGDALIRASRAPKKISSNGNMVNRNRLKKIIADSWHSELIPASKKEITELERNAEFFSNLSNRKHKIRYPHLKISNSWISPKLKGKKFFVIAPGTSGTVDGREWPPKFFADLCQKIFKQTNLMGIICGTNREHPIAEMIINLSGIPLENFCGKTTLIKLAGILKQSLLTISNDTGLIYISSAVGTPSICILGGGHFGRFLPFPNLSDQKKNINVVFNKMSCFGCNWKCIYTINEGDSAPCISNISVDDVWSKVNTVLQKELPSNSLDNN